MFNNHALTVGVTRTPSSKKTTENAQPNPYTNPETMIPIVKDLVVDGAKLAGALYAGGKVLNTLCEIAKIAAKAKF